MIVNNSTIINKTNNQFSPQIIEHKKDHDIIMFPGIHFVYISYSIFWELFNYSIRMQLKHQNTYRVNYCHKLYDRKIIIIGKLTLIFRQHDYTSR